MKNEDQARSHKLEARPSRRGPGSIAAGVLLTLIVALPVIMAVAAAVYYIFGPAEGHFHADSADTLYWANASFESGKILDPTFRYAAVLPFSASLWMTPLIAVFGFTMTAQNIGMMIFVLVFCASLGYFCRRAEMSVGWCTLSVGMTLMILSSSDKLREVMLGHVIYYSLGLVLFFLIAGLMLSVSSRGAALMSASPEAAPTSKKLLFGLAFIMLVVISAGAATDGAEIIVLATLPALGGVAAERIFDGNRRVFSRENIPAWIALLGVLAGTLCGIAGGIPARIAEKKSGNAAAPLPAIRKPEPSALPDSVTAAALSTLNVCAYVAFFSCVVGCISCIISRFSPSRTTERGFIHTAKNNIFVFEIVTFEPK